MTLLQQNKTQRLITLAVMVLWCFAASFTTLASNGSENGSFTANSTTAQTSLTEAPLNKQKKTEVKSKTTKAQNKSVLDADVLASPISYFKNAFFNEDEDTDSDSSSSSTMVIAIKAIIATLLSTIM
jgi:hypothetical protein